MDACIEVWHPVKTASITLLTTMRYSFIDSPAGDLDKWTPVQPSAKMKARRCVSTICGGSDIAYRVT